MAIGGLKRHYEEKYAAEPRADEVSYTPWPCDRFAAARAFIPRYFSGGSVLEIAAGDGRVARSLVDTIPSITSYTAVELSAPRAAAMAADITDPRFRAIEGDAEALPDDIGSFDLVIMIAVIEHLIDPVRAMRSIRALMNPGGMVYIDTPNVAKWTRRLKLLAGRFPSTASANEGLTTYEGAPSDLFDEGHLHYFTYRSLELMLKGHCGFREVVRRGYGSGTLRRALGRRLDFAVSAAWPSMFSDLALLARI